MSLWSLLETLNNFLFNQRRHFWKKKIIMIKKNCILNVRLLTHQPRREAVTVFIREQIICFTSWSYASMRPTSGWPGGAADIAAASQLEGCGSAWVLSWFWPDGWRSTLPDTHTELLTLQFQSHAQLTEQLPTYSKPNNHQSSMVDHTARTALPAWVGRQNVSNVL